MKSSHSTQLKNTRCLVKSQALQCLRVICFGCCVLLTSFLLTSCAEKPAVESTSYKEGQATLVYDTHRAEHPEAFLDLDTGNMIDNPDADVALIVSGGTSLVNVLQPINGAKKSMLAGKEDATLGDCKQHLEDLSVGNIPDFPPGKRICILTNQDRLALLEINNVINPEQGVTSVQLKYTIEIVPQPK